MLLPEAKFKNMIICDKRLESEFFQHPPPHHPKLRNLLLKSASNFGTFGRILSVAELNQSPEDPCAQMLSLGPVNEVIPRGNKLSPENNSWSKIP